MQQDSRLAPLSLSELHVIANELQAIVGAQLQECVQSASELGLGFYHAQSIGWLWVDLHPQRPMIVRLEQIPSGRKKMVRPLTLFVRSRILGRRLKSVRVDQSLGRVLVLEFLRAPSEDTDLPVTIELRLFPHGQNIIVRDGIKSISELKPKELSQSVHGEYEATPPREWRDVEAKWRELQLRTPGKPVDPSGALANGEKEFKRAVEKKQNALQRMHEELILKRDPRWSEAGQWLKTHGQIEGLPQELSEFIDSSKSLSWNIETCFKKSKDLARKSEGTEQRIAAVEKELNDLIARGSVQNQRSPQSQNSASGKANENFLARATAKGRRHKIGDDLEVYIGKSAADNLLILRRAQPFDYWLHLRDSPGSHAILRRTRGRVVSDAEFALAGQWVTEQSFGKSATELRGERVDLLIVECRFVRPIKGDRLGRVTYTNDRVLTLRL